MRAEGDSGSRSHKRGDAETRSGVSNTPDTSSAQKERSQLRSFAIEDGEALESAQVDSEVLPAFDAVQKPSGTTPRDTEQTEFPFTSVFESLDADLYDAELSSLQDGAQNSASSTSEAPAARSAQTSTPMNSSNGTVASNAPSGGTSAVPGSPVVPAATVRAAIGLRSPSTATGTTASSHGAATSRPAYRPRSALSLARRRMIAKYLPFGWQQVLTFHSSTPVNSNASFH